VRSKVCPARDGYVVDALFLQFGVDLGVTVTAVIGHYSKWPTDPSGESFDGRDQQRPIRRLPISTW
jgi:hypothetical protein